MKRLLTIILFLQIISNNVFAEELIRIPYLIEHYSHHSREHKDVSGFMDFLAMHYMNGDTQKGLSHDNEDKDLPFRHDDNCANTHLAFSVTLPTATALNATLTELPFILSRTRDNFQSLHISRIWQPPRNK